MAENSNPNATDPFLDEVRELKRRAVERAGGEVARLFDQLQDIENQLRSRVVSPEQLRDIKRRDAELDRQLSESADDRRHRKAS